MSKAGADLKKRMDDLKRTLRRPPMKDRVELERGSKHTKVVRRTDNKILCTIPDTPSDYRSIRNVVATLTRANVFDTVPEEITVRTMPMPWEIRQDGLQVLTKLGYIPGATGRAAGALRRYSELIGEGTFKLGIEEKQRKPDGYCALIRQVIVQDYPTTAEALDQLIAGTEYALHKVTRVGNDLVKDPPKVEDTPSAHDVSELPAVKIAEEIEKEVFEEVGPMYNGNGKVSEDSLYLRILAAILDPNVTREEALQLSVEVAHLENG